MTEENGQTNAGPEPDEVQAEDATVKAQDQLSAQEAANAAVNYEFDNRIRPAIEEIAQYARDIANQGDQAGLAHVRFCLDTLTQRFRIAPDAPTTTPEELPEEEPQTAEEQVETVEAREVDAEEATDEEDEEQ